MQILGGLGITDDTIVARLFSDACLFGDVRPFPIYDGPSEVHHWPIARRVLRVNHGSANVGNDTRQVRRCPLTGHAPIRQNRRE
jgi:hypothetical protein